MASTFNVGGLITGLDTETLISQLMQLERQPITRLEERMKTLQTQRDAIRDLRTQLLALRNNVRDFRLGSVFSQFEATSNEEKVLGVTVSGENPVIGSYTIQVQQLASATVAGSGGRMGAAINPDAGLNSNGMTTSVDAGTFTINGVSFTVDPATQTLNQVLAQINGSAAGVTATYDAATDKVTIANTVAGNTALINFGGSDDTSNFLTAIGVKSATQSTGATGSTEAVSIRNLGAVEPGKKLNEANFLSGTVTAGTFFVNGISITVDPAVDSLSDVLQRITDSDAQVSASYDNVSDTIKLVSKTTGSRTIGLTAGTSNFLTSTNLSAAIQTAGNDAQFSVNGGPVQTRNSNEISDAVGGLTLRLLSLGSSTVTVAGDDDAVVEDINEFVTAFNETVDKIAEMVSQSGALAFDGSIQAIEIYIRDVVFGQVAGITGDYGSLLDIGISTGSAFDPSAVQHLHLDEDKFREALRDDRLNVESLFTNTGKTGIADALFAYLDGITLSTGFLNARAKSNGSIDQQIQAIQDQMARVEERVDAKEERLRRQFTMLEQFSAGFQAQNSALSALSQVSSYF